MTFEIKVLHVHTLPVVSGSGINTLLSMCGQQAEGYAVSLATRGGGRLIEQVEQNGMTVHKLKHMVWGPNPIQDLLVVFELRELMLREGFAVVHTHNSKAGFVGRLAARLAEVPVVVHTVHGFAFHDAEPFWKSWIYKHLERLANSWCHKFIFISQPLIDWALKERITDETKIEKIYSGIDVRSFREPADRSAIRREFGFNEADFVIGEIAKLWEGKGHVDLLEAIAQLKDDIPQLKLFFIGEGKLESTLREKARELGLEHAVVFGGFREDVHHVVHAMDVHVLPSHFEGMGRAILESMAAGVATIGTRVGGIPDLIKDGQTGLLVPVKSPEALAEAIRRLYNESALREKVALQGQQFVSEQLSAETMCLKINALYAELLHKRGIVIEER